MGSYQSPLLPHADTILERRASGATWSAIAAELKEKHGVEATPNNLSTFAKRLEAQRVRVPLDGWTSASSAYAIVVRRTEDAVAAVNFARDNNLRLVDSAKPLKSINAIKTP